MKFISIQGLNRGCSQIILGTSAFRLDTKDLVFELLDLYAAAGGNVLDTSPIYGSGQSELAIRLWLEARQNRKDMMIVSKACHHVIDENGVHHPERKRVRPEYVTQDLMESLDRMGVDFFDIYLLHRDDPSVPVGELVDILEEHKKAGLIKVYGVSNWSTERIEAANRYAAAKGYAGIVVNSPSLSLAQVNEPRWVGCVYTDDNYVKWHKKKQLPLFAWAAQASGFFSGAWTPQTMKDPDIARVYCNAGNWERIRRAEQLASQKGPRFTLNHIALAYVLNQPFPTCAIIGPKKAEHLSASFQALAISLTKAERLWLDLSARHAPVSPAGA